MLVLAPALSAKAGDPAKGKAVFDQQCMTCHNADSTEKKMGPGLKGLFKKSTEAKVRTRIDEGDKKDGMPAYKDILSSSEKDNLVAYLKTL